MERNRIFLVEDDPNFGMVLQNYLELNDFKVQWEQDGISALQRFKPNQFDICIFDVMLPKMDGFKVAEGILEKDPAIPFIFLTAKGLKEDVLKGFKLGADDYIVKPFDSEVLLYKIRAIINRNNQQLTSIENVSIQLGNYTFDYSKRKLIFNKQEIKLSPKENELLRLLIEKQNNILARELALTKIWEKSDYFSARSMDVYITKLRKYLSQDSSINIENIHGEGYILHVDIK